MTAEKFLRGTVLTAVFALPFIALYVANSMFFPYITGKNFAFRIFVEVAASAWLALAFLNSAYRPKRSGLLWGFAALLAIMAAADIFGAYPLKSFWSNYERMDGWVTLAHLFAYFVVAVSVLNTEKLWRYWWYTSLAVSGIVGITGLFQLLGAGEGPIRLDARLGNATYLGVYMLFHIAIAALLFARTWVKDVRNRATAAWIYGPLIALNSVILFFTATRGAMLGLLGGAVLAGLILVFLNPRSRTARWTIAGLVALMVFGGIFWMARETAFVRGILPLYRIATLLEDTTTYSRFMNWGMAWQGVQERPILGWGHENYAAVFDKYYNPNMWGQEPWFDRTHNIVLDWLIAGGVLGFAAYLSLYFFALLALWRSGAFEPYERAILTGLFAGYFFYLLFTFDNILSYILFVSTLAYIAARATEGGRTLGETIAIGKGTAPVAAAAAAVLACGLVWFVNAEAIQQNRLLIQAIQPQTGGATQNLALFTGATAIQSVGSQETREQFSQGAMSVVADPKQPVELKQQFVQGAVAELEKQAADAPQNARAPFFLGGLLDRVGMFTEAKKWLDEARTRSPRKQSILFELGLNAQARGATEESLSFFKEAYEGAPEYQEARQQYVAALIRAGKDAEAEPILQSLVAEDAATQQRIASALAERKRYTKIEEIWRAHIEQQPQDAQARFLLAVALYESGNLNAAIRELETAKEVIPSAAAQADQYIAQMQAGG